MNDSSSIVLLILFGFVIADREIHFFAISDVIMKIVIHYWQAWLFFIFDVLGSLSKRNK